MLEPDLQGVKNTLQKYTFPADVIVEVTRFCNLKCIMCPYPNLKRKQGDMKFETFKKISDEIAMENPATRIWLAIMGEPLLLKNRLIEIIKYAKSKGITVNVNTNGIYLSSEMSEKIILAGVDNIIISIDGFSNETYSKIRIGGDYNTLVENVRALLKLKKNNNFTKPEVITQFIVMDENEHETELFKQFWLNQGAVVKIRPKLGWGKSIEAKNLELVKSKTKRFPCSWLTRTVSIHWDGTFAQCDADQEEFYSLGNFDSQTIKEVWEGELAKKRERHWALDFDFEPCKSCNDWLAGRSYFYYPE